MLKFIYSSIILIFIIACNNDAVVNKEHNKYPNRCKLEYVGTKEFPLDDETSPYRQYISFIDNDSTQIFSFLNEYNNSIYFYDYKSSSFLRKIKYEKEGPDGVLSTQGYLYLNDDSIFVYSYKTKLLCLTNSNAKVLEKYKLYEKSRAKEYEKAERDESLIIYPAPFLQTKTPMKKFGNNIIVFGFFAAEFSFETPTNRPVCVMVNLEDKSINYLINYPEQYSKYNWGGGFTYRMPYYDIDNQSMVISFAAHHSLVRYDFATNSQKDFYAGSSEIKSIKPYPQPNKEISVESRAEIDWFATNPAYGGIIYDKYKKLYYRFAGLPAENYNPNSRANRKPVLIIVLDSDLQYLGEVYLPTDKNLNTEGCFISEDGIHIQINNKEDNLAFYRYNILVNDEN
jgi:hypothetical protein